MQPWSGGRRERSSSVVLLGKLSAIVRRGSIFQAEPEDVRDSSSSNSSNSSNNSEEQEQEHDDDRATQRKSRHTRRCSVGATPYMTMWDPKSNGRSTNQRLQFYPARPLVAAALAKPLSQAELMRRATLEAEMKDFGAMHTRFAPSMPLDDQEEKEEMTEEEVGEKQEGVMDNNEQENFEEEERRVAHTEEQQDGNEKRGTFSDDEEMLDFSSVNMPTSVRRLMSRIMSESLMTESDVPVDMSNQEEDDEDDEYDEEDVDRIDDVEELELDDNSSEQDEERSISWNPSQAEACLDPEESWIIPTLVPQEMHPGKRHKKSAFSRIGPRVLETLHLRKKRKTYLFTDEELETIEGARWKIVELAFRFGGKHRSYLVQAINMFFPLLKYGRRGGAHATRLHCNCCGTLQWQHKRGKLSEAVDLAEVLQVLDGRQTAVFRKYASNSVLDACSFSVVFRGRTLDLETQSSSHRDWLVSALRTLVAYARRQRRIEQQAIAERTILPLEDDLLPDLVPDLLPPVSSSPARATPVPSPVAALPNRRLDEATMMAALPPNYKIRNVY
ncbi:hypothetical protein JG688_00003594 [Phytophthora aleatoria]|uniref:Uncharacterized protein n=1 Tax=Phytophthora aleatoria TaxID=2496075 RepID=A0A8J5JA87_9STRA|nr:hypothetical protein JG688_00003594 [Phytophthora aleatoria]